MDTEIGTTDEGCDPEESAPLGVSVERIVMCEKCGSGDILTRYVEDGELIDSSSSKRIDNEFIYSSQYTFYCKLRANKEHLSRHCRNCQYGWRENIIGLGT